MDWKKIQEDTPRLKYVAYGLEKCPRTQRDHNQGWLHLARPMSLRQVKAFAGNSHLEMMFGTLSQNDAYCSKEGKLIEFGDRPAQGKRKDLDDLKDGIKAGQTERELYEHHPAAWRYSKAMSKYRELVQCDEASAFREVTVDVYAGGTGTGKTRKAMRGDDVFMIHASSMQWMDGYKGEKTLVIDEYDNNMPLPKLLGWCDGYKQRLPVKGSFTYARWTQVIITTNLSKAEFHPKAKTMHLKAFERRLDDWCDFDTDEVSHDLDLESREGVIEHVQ